MQCWTLSWNTLILADRKSRWSLAARQPLGSNIVDGGVTLCLQACRREERFPRCQNTLTGNEKWHLAADGAAGRRHFAQYATRHLQQRTVAGFCKQGKMLRVRSDREKQRRLEGSSNYCEIHYCIVFWCCIGRVSQFGNNKEEGFYFLPDA